ncbi:MAG: flagellar basal-body rod protein FlgF [Bdellovibrionales bacterium]|nr:flagellar basal-body rod protein FlgF [Bdellovibrionales bacterium]
MSNKGIFTALSGAMAQSQRLDTIANNIANSNTDSFKKDKQVFQEYLTANEKLPDVIQVPRIPSSIESFYDVQAADRGYVNSIGTYTDHSQGGLRATGNALDVALDGPGFFEVLTPRGVRFTRSGSFKISPNGQLVTKQGYPVLKSGTQDPETRTIQISSRNLTISYGGDIYEGGEFTGALSVVNVNDPDSMKKEGQAMYSLKPNYPVDLQPATDAQVHQGYVESSNVNIVQEMTDMIQASRSFESTQKAIKAFDMLNGKLINEVGKVR